MKTSIARIKRRLLIGLTLCQIACAEIHAENPLGETAVGVSMIELIATPSKFTNREVQFIAFVAATREGAAGFLSEEAALYHDTLSAVSIPGASAMKLISGRYYYVRGTFRPDLKGAKGVYSAEITDLKRLDERKPLRFWTTPEGEAPKKSSSSDSKAQ